MLHSSVPERKECDCKVRLAYIRMFCVPLLLEPLLSSSSKCNSFSIMTRHCSVGALVSRATVMQLGFDTQRPFPLEHLVVRLHEQGWIWQLLAVALLLLYLYLFLYWVEIPDSEST